MSIDPSPASSALLAKLERLPIFGLTVAVLFGSLFLKYIHDVDMYWQLQLGQIISETGRLPTHEPFLHGKGEVRHIPLCWLSQVIDYQVWSLGGWPLLQISDAALWIGAYAVVAWKLRRGGAWAWPAVLALLYGYLPAVTFASIRPQSFALLGFGLTMVLTWSELKLRKKLALAALLFAVWQNCHPSVLMAGAWLGPMTVGAFVRWLRRPNGERGSPPWDLAGVSALAILASFACPEPLETFRLARTNEGMSKFLEVSEWKPLFWDALSPWDQYGPEGRGTALAALAILALILAFRRRRLKIEEVIVALLLAALMTQMYRFAVFFGLALIPVAYRAFAPAPNPSPPPPVRYWRAILLAAFAIAIGVCLGRFAIAHIKAPERTPLDPHMDYFPVEAVARMEEIVPEGTVYCNFFWGGVVVRAGYPKWHVSHDGRYYLFTREEWEWYWAGMSQDPVGGFRVSAADIIATYRPVAFLLRKDFDDGLIAKLDEPASGWKRVPDRNGAGAFDRGQAVVFVPR